MSAKQGRGALVRRLRREYGITEGEARCAVNGDAWWGLSDKTPDGIARHFQERRRLCPPRPQAWCWTDDMMDAATMRIRRDRHRTTSLMAACVALGSIR